MEVIKICIHCNKEITAEGRNKFCSAECQSAFYGKEKKEHCSLFTDIFLYFIYLFIELT